MKRMTARTRVVVILSIITAAALLVTSGLHLYTASRNDSLTSAEAWGVGIIVVVALASVGWVYWMRNRRVGDSSRLQEPYYAAYEVVVDVLKTSPMSARERSETQGDLLELLLDAQQAKRPVDEVVGDDPAAFARQVQEAFGYRNRLVHLLLSGVLYAVAYAFMVQIVSYYTDGAASFFEVRADVSILFLLGLAAFVVAPMLQAMVRRGEPGWELVLPIGVMVVAIVLLEVLRASFYELGWVQTLVDGKVKMMPNLWALLLWLAIAALALGGQALQRKRSLERL